MQRAVDVEDVGHAMNLDARRGLSGGDLMVVGGSAITLLALLLPWWDNGLGSTANGLHDWGWLSFLSLLLVAALFTVRTFFADTRAAVELAVADPVAYMIGGAAEMVGAVVFWLVNNSRLVGGVKYGVFVCVVGGAVTVAAGYVKNLESQHDGDKPARHTP